MHHAMQVFVSVQGQQQGPFPLSEINAMLAEGRLAAFSTLAWHDGCPDWIPLAQVPGVVMPGEPAPVVGRESRAPVPSPPSGSPGPAPLPGQPSREAAVVSTVIPYKNPMALAAYYLGIFSLIPFLGGVLALPAVVLGALGLRRRTANPAAKGAIHAWIGITLGILSLVGHGVGLSWMFLS